MSSSRLQHCRDLHQDFEIVVDIIVKLFRLRSHTSRLTLTSALSGPFPSDLPMPSLSVRHLRGFPPLQLHHFFVFPRLLVSCAFHFAPRIFTLSASVQPRMAVHCAAPPRSPALHCQVPRHRCFISEALFSSKIYLSCPKPLSFLQSAPC